MHELVRGQNLIPQLREVRVDDIIGDRWVRVNHYAALWLRARRVMIVGCGTLGQQLARKAADAGADEIVLVDRDDNALQRLGDELRLARMFPWVSLHHGSAVDAEFLVELAKQRSSEVVLYASVSGWSSANRDRRRQRRILTGIHRLVELLPTQAPRVERFVWVSGASVALPNSPARALAAVAEAIATINIGDDDSPTLVRCAVRIPEMYTSRNSIIASLEHQARLGIALRVPPPPAKQRFIHAHEAAELVLQAAQVARPRETLAVDRGEDVPLHELAVRMLRLRGLDPLQEAEIVDDDDLADEYDIVVNEDDVTDEYDVVVRDDDLVVDDAPRPAGAPTAVEGVLSLGWPHESPALRKRVQELAHDEEPDVLAFARRHLAKLRTDSALSEPASEQAAHEGSR